MRLSPGIALVLSTALLIAFGACSEDVTRVSRPPVVSSFEPPEQTLDAFVGDTLRFSIRAFDPDKSTLRGHFTLGDSMVSSAPSWEYVVGDTGVATVTGFVADDTYEASIVWQIQRHRPVNLPPVITSFLPIEPNPTMIIGNSLAFAVDAVDPEEEDLSYHYTVDDTVTALGDNFVFRPKRVGPRTVRAVVTDGVNFDTHEWHLLVTTEPDTIPPAEVTITSVETGAEPGDVNIEWIAVGQDGEVGTASNYLVRTSPAPILTENDWERATERPDVPVPLPAGETMRMVIQGVIPARLTYVAVRAIDAFGNVSPLGGTPSAYARGMHITGIVRDAVTYDPIPGVRVRLSNFEETTAADGTFEFFELPPVDGGFTVTDDGIPGDVGAFYDFATPYEIVHEDDVELFLIPNLQMISPYYSDFYLWFRAMTDTPGNPYGAQQRRWKLPIDLYVPEFTSGGLEYAAIIREIAAEFDAILGRQVFRIVSERPAVGVYIRYRSDITYDNFGVTLWTADRYPQLAKIEHRTVYTAATEGTLREVSRHELGHALGLNHSVDPAHVMVGGTAPSAGAMTTDEIRILRVRYNLPRGLNVTFFGNE